MKKENNDIIANEVKDEKKNGKYISPPSGCVGTEVITHNVTYSDTGNTIGVIDDATITNTETNEVRNVKIVYSFVYEKNDDKLNFVLYQVNHENK